MVWTDLHHTLHRRLRHWPDSPPPLWGESRLLLAVSGGQDSLCLWRLFLDLQPQWPWQLAIAHCDHGWPTDQGMADHVASLAHRHQMPFFLAQAENLPQTEGAARHWRYQALTAIAEEEQIPYVLTGHTQTDRAETFFLNLLRGSGPDGLTALTWQRPLSPQVTLLRPLLDISRAATAAFCHDQGLPIWTDPVNDHLHYRRNRIRQELMPYLHDHFNPHLEKTLTQTLELLTEDGAYLREHSETLYRQLHCPPHTLARSPLQPQPLALQRRVIRLFLQSFQRHHPTFDHIQSVVDLIHAPHRAQSPTLPGQWIVTVDHDYLVAKTAIAKGDGE